MKGRILRLVLSLLGCAALSAAAAAPSATGALDQATVLYPHAAAATGTPSGAGPGGTSAMIAVVLLGVAGGWMLWLKVRRGSPTGRGPQQLQIEETRSLGNRQFLVIAAYQDRKFLLGVCPGKIDLLSPLDGANPPERPKFPL